MKLAFTPDAAKDIQKLPPDIGQRIVKKMQWFAAQEHPLSFAKKLTNPLLGSHRFRIGDYRVLVEIEHGIVHVLNVLAIKHRKEAYDL